MNIGSLSAVVECKDRQYVGVAALHNGDLVDVNFYCKDAHEPELVYVASVRDKKIPFSQKGVEAYVKRIVEYHADSFYDTYRKGIFDKAKKEALAKVVESVSIASNFSTPSNSPKQFSSLKITLAFTDDFNNKALPQVFKDKCLYGFINGSTLQLNCSVE